MPPHRISVHQIIQIVLQPAVFSLNTMMRGCSSGTCLTCSSTIFLPSSGVLILSSPWASVLLLGPFLPTTGLLPNQTISPHSPCLLASFAHSGRLLHSCEFNSSNSVYVHLFFFRSKTFFFFFYPEMSGKSLSD